VAAITSSTGQSNTCARRSATCIISRLSFLFPRCGTGAI